MKSTLEKINPFKKLPYYVFWFFVSLAWFSLSIIIPSLLNERRFLVLQTFFALEIWFLPSIFILSSNKFTSILEELKAVFWSTENDYDVWLKHAFIRIYSLKTWPSKLVTLFIVSMANATVIHLGLPYKTLIAKILCLLALQVLFYICGQGAYMLIAVAIALNRLSIMKCMIPFFYLSYPPLIKLQRFYSSFSLIYLVAYIFLTIAISQSPYGFNIEMQIWLGIIAIGPIGSFLWSIMHNYLILRNAKNLHIKMINNRIEIEYGKLLRKYKKDDIENLKALMEIQDKVENTRTMPIEMQFVLTLFVSFFPGLIQLLIFLYG